MKRLIGQAARFLRTAILIDLFLAAVTAVSFLFFGSFSSKDYSDRLFMVGIAVMVIGSLGLFAVIGASRHFGLPFNVTKPKDAKKLHDNIIDILRSTDKRYDVSIQIWVVGVLCIILSAVIHLALVGLGIGV